MQTEPVVVDAHGSGSRRGALRVYLGAAPGVGKTYRMLDEARRRRDRGADVVVAWIDTHGRERTVAMVEGLEVLPRRQVTYQGTVREELDLPAVLARAPKVALVDELAHSKVPGVEGPGAEHTKRWQDVDALLDAGIDVITTINVQHLESLNDVVESITGVRQRETVPDRFVRSADAIELVDMSPSALRRRLAHGNVYPADRIDAALAQFFREGNLTALREVALLWLADRVDEGLGRYRAEHQIEATWAARERIVAAITGGAESEVLMRRAARIASRTGGGEWSALYVSRGDGLVQATPERLQSLRRLTEDLGGTFHSVVGDDTPSAILQFARAENATQVIIGASRRGRISTLVRPGVGEIVIAQSGEIDVHIVTHDEARRAERSLRRSAVLGRRRRRAGYAIAVLAPVLLAAGLTAMPDLTGLSAESMLSMSVVVAAALVGGIGPGVTASLVSGFTLNYFFTDPVGSLTVASGDNAVGLVLFVLVALGVSSVVDLASRRTTQADAATAEADALSVLAHGLLHAGSDLPAVLASAAELFAVPWVAVIARDGAGGESVIAEVGQEPPGATRVRVDIDEQTDLMLAGRDLPARDRRLLTSYAVHVGVLLERRRARADSAERRALREADQARTALLAAVSHDLRTPLAAIIAAVDSLRHPTIVWSQEDERALLDTVSEGAGRLNDLVTNLLDMSRIQLGAVPVRTEVVDLTEAIAQTLAGIAHGDRVQVRVAPAARTAVADGGLLERVIENLVMNALAHGHSAGGAADLRIDVDRAGEGADAPVVVRVIDRGAGLPEAERASMFEPFQRGGDVPRGSGVGLGLAVARGLAEAMGGTLEPDDTPGGGLTLALELPSGPTCSPQEEP